MVRNVCVRESESNSFAFQANLLTAAVIERRERVREVEYTFCKKVNSVPLGL